MNCDMIYTIFTFLDNHDLIKCSQVCTTFYKVSKMEQLWKPLFDETFYNVTVNDNFRENYKKYNILNTFICKYCDDYYDDDGLGPLPCTDINSTVLVNNYILYDTKISNVPQEICLLTNLTKIIMDNCLKAFPLHICQLIGLRHLRLCNNTSLIIPPEIGQLTNLFTLNLHHNKIQLIPIEMSQLTRLLILNLSHNELQHIPNALNQLTKLHELFLDYNKLKIIPNLGTLTTLGCMDISYNDLESVEMNFDNMVSLRFFFISNQHVHLLHKIPRGIQRI